MPSFPPSLFVVVIEYYILRIIYLYLYLSLSVLVYVPSPNQLLFIDEYRHVSDAITNHLSLHSDFNTKKQNIKQTKSRTYFTMVEII